MPRFRLSLLHILNPQPQELYTMLSRILTGLDPRGDSRLWRAIRSCRLECAEVEVFQERTGYRAVVHVGDTEAAHITGLYPSRPAALRVALAWAAERGHPVRGHA